MSGDYRTVAAGGFNVVTGEIIAKVEAIDTPPKQFAKVIEALINRYAALHSQIEETTPRQLLRLLELEVGDRECRNAAERKK